ncbi:unnamed protein product [Calypogeia fissa]
MAHARDLYKTKLCTLYQRGNCPRHSCSFAHGEAELRRFPGAGGFTGRQDRQENHRGDLRDRLDRRGSPPPRRRSPSRDGRGGRPGSLSDRRFSPRDRGRSLSRSPGRRRQSRSYSPTRSPSHKRESKKLRVEAPDAHLSDVSGDHYEGDNGKHPEDNKVKSSAVSPSPSPRDTLQEQLRQVQLDNDALLDEKENLEKALAKKVEEASVLTGQNTELETKLTNSQEDCKRYNSKMKKLIKVYMRFTRAQEEVKKTQAKLQKMAEELPFDESQRPSAFVDDSDYYNLSDGELERPPNGISAQGLSALNVPAAKGTDTEESLAIAKRKRLHSVREKTRAYIRNMQQNGGNVRSSLDDDLVQNSRPVVIAVSEKSSKVDMFTSVDVGASKERRPASDVSPSLQSSPVEKVRGRDVRLNLPATGLAAHARDFHSGAELEEDRSNFGLDRERVSLNLNMPPSKSYQTDGDFFGIGHLPTQYSKYKGDDEEVDVDGVDTDMDEHVGVEPQGVYYDQAVTVDN